jgi:hypothetical protein
MHKDVRCKCKVSIYAQRCNMNLKPLYEAVITQWDMKSRTLRTIHRRTLCAILRCLTPAFELEKTPDELPQFVSPGGPILLEEGTSPSGVSKESSPLPPVLRPLLPAVPG